MNPDIIVNRDSDFVTFIFFNNELFYAKDIAHFRLALTYNLDIAELNRSLNLQGRVSSSRFLLESPQKIIAFWELNHLLKPCLNALLSKDLIKSTDIVVLDSPKLVKDVMQSNQHSLRDLSKERAIHLLNGMAKKQALLNMGIKPKLKYKNVAPGEKHWAISSESFKNWLETNGGQSGKVI